MNIVDTKDTYMKNIPDIKTWNNITHTHGKNRRIRSYTNNLLTVVNKQVKSSSVKNKSNKQKTHCIICDELGHNLHRKVGLSYQWICEKCNILYN